MSGVYRRALNHGASDRRRRAITRPVRDRVYRRRVLLLRMVAREKRARRRDVCERERESEKRPFEAQAFHL